MTPTEIIVRELQSRGFTTGLIRGFFGSSGEKWGREISRCKSDGDALELAKDIAAALELRRGNKIRAHDYRCLGCGESFEEYLTYNPYDEDELDAARQQSASCPHCGAQAKPVLLRAPGMHVAPWAIRFGGQTYDKDDFDAHIDSLTNRPKPQRFYDKPGFTEEFLGQYEETAIKTMAGEIPPPPPIDPTVADEVATAITKGVQ